MDERDKDDARYLNMFFMLLIQKALRIWNLSQSLGSVF